MRRSESKSEIPHFNNNKTTESGDAYCENGPNDTISQIRFSNVSKVEDNPEFISASSWDSTIRVWEMNKSYSSIETKFMGDCNFDAPVLGHCWMADNDYIIAACADNCVKLWDISKNSVTKLGEHKFCVKDVFFNSHDNMIISSSFDGHLKFWDGRDSRPAHDVNLEPYKIWTFSYADPLLAGVLSDNRSKKPDFICVNPMKYQSRCIEVAPDATCYAVTSIEGRCGIKNIDMKNMREKTVDDFNFKCHRKSDSSNNVYPVHMVSFNAVQSTFSCTLMTCGGDGNYCIWDKDKRKRLKSTMGCDSPITACKMSLNAKFAAYAFGYDWSLGMYGAGTSSVGLFIHPLLEKDVKAS